MLCQIGACFACGVIFGFALQKAGVYKVSIIREQFKFESCVMLKVRVVFGSVLQPKYGTLMSHDCLCTDGLLADVLVGCCGINVDDHGVLLRKGFHARLRHRYRKSRESSGPGQLEGPCSLPAVYH
jgi:hypothetical protein